jgi:hypothetical protein
VLALSKHADIHVGNRDANNIRIDSTDDEIEHDLVLGGNYVEHIADTDVGEWLGSREDEANRAENDNKQENGEDEAPCESAAPAAVVAVSTFEVPMQSHAISSARRSDSRASTRWYQRRSLVVSHNPRINVVGRQLSVFVAAVAMAVGYTKVVEAGAVGL